MRACQPTSPAQEGACFQVKHSSSLLCEVHSLFLCNDVSEKTPRPLEPCMSHLLTRRPTHCPRTGIAPCGWHRTRTGHPPLWCTEAGVPASPSCQFLMGVTRRQMSCGYVLPRGRRCQRCQVTPDPCVPARKHSGSSTRPLGGRETQEPTACPRHLCTGPGHAPEVQPPAHQVLPQTPAPLRTLSNHAASLSPPSKTH